MAPPRLSWLSTTFGSTDGQVIRLDRTLLASLASAARSITVVSAFYDAPFLRSLAHAVPSSRRSKVSIRVFLHKFAGKRRTDQVEKLRKVSAAWRKAFSDADFFLVSRGALFHPKLLLFASGKRSSLLVGSANATSAAYDDNEEIMLKLDGNVPGAVDAYLKLIEGASTPLDDVSEPTINSLVAFFRAGTVYYKPNVVAAFRFNLNLPTELRERMTTLRVNIRGITARAANTYNPFVGVGLRADEERALSDDDAEAAAPKRRVLIRPYGVQTCYGWWVPNAYRDDLGPAIEAASERKAELLRRLASFLKRKRPTIVAAAGRRFEKLERFAVRNEVDLLESRSERLKRFDEFVDRAVRRLAVPEWQERAAKSYVEAPVPEVWTDPVTSGEFSDTFFEYLEYVASSRAEPLVWKSLQAAVPDISDGDGADGIKKRLGDRLRAEAWTDDLWERPRRSTTA